jgi:hypothetical protein
MAEIMLRFFAVLFSGVMLVAFGWYFSFGTDTLQHDYVFFGGGLLTLLAGLGTIGGSLLMLMLQVREYGIEGIESDVTESNTIETPTPARGGAAPAAATAGAGDEVGED